MDRDLYVLLWLDPDGPQCALYEDRAQAEADADLVGGHVELRTVHRSERLRTGRFIRGEKRCNYAEFPSTRRRENRTPQAPGCDALLVLKTRSATRPVPPRRRG